MSVPFSNTTLRVPRGFGNLLEGLAREVLRDQPDDIPTFAALYFTELLRAREESGIDPAEWGAKLEDRFYNSHAFKETATQGNSGSAEASRRDKAGHSETFGNNGTEDSTLKDLNANNASDNLENVEEQQRYNLDKKLDEESGETEHEAAPELPKSGTVDDPNEILENAQVQKENKKANEFVDVNICRSELEPTPLPSFGGLANVDVCAEEINHPLDGPSESTENKRGLIDAVLESPKPLLQDGEQSESQGMQVAHDQLTESLDETLDIEQDTDEQANEMSDVENTEEPDFDSDTEEAEQRVSENTDAILNDNGPEEKSTEQGYLESAESTAAREKDRTETNNTSTAEAGHKTEEHIEEKDDILDNEDQEETNHEYSSTNDFTDDEPADTTNYTSDNNARSLMDMKGNENDDETCDSQSEVIDVLDEVVMSTGHQCPTNTGEHEDGNSLDEQTSSEIMNRLTEEELLAAQTDALEPDSQMTGNDSDTDVTEDVTDGKILNTDVTDTSEKELITENINDESDFDSDGSDAKEIAEDEIAKYVQESYNDVSNTHQQDTMKTDDEENIETNDPELTEDVLPTDVFVHGTEEAHHWPLSDGTEGEAEAMIEHPRESQTHPEYNETNKDQEYHLEDQEGEIQESTNERENMANPESLREQEEECSQPQEEEDIMDIPLDDPEANKAAAKIQAGFRGHMTRKKMKPGEKPSEEVSSSGEALNGSQGDTGGTDGVETDATSGPEQ